MRKPITVIIPAFNEEKSVGLVVSAIPRQWVEEVIVIDNASTDLTAEVAAKAGATVLTEPQKGYGKACLKGLEYIAHQAEKPLLIIFMDADHSDYPEELPLLADPILTGDADMVIGSRALGQREKGAMTPQQVFGNWLATRLIWWIYREKFTDLGPFRAIRYAALLDLEMRDQNYGWTVEMQVKAAKKNLKSLEVPVRYRKRIGVSKVSGTVKGTLMAGYKILFTIFKYL
jgi:glycosyltransferase involved in cell wall biosynthesis